MLQQHILVKNSKGIVLDRMTFKIFSFDLGDSGEDAALLHSWLHAAIRNSILSQSFDREFQHVKCVMA